MIEKWLVEDWRNFTHWWSVRMTLIGGILAGVLSSVPAMPPEVQAIIPIKYRIAAISVWCVTAIITRVAKQAPRP